MSNILIKSEYLCRACLNNVSEDDDISLYDLCLSNNDENQTNVKYCEVLTSLCGVYAHEADGLPKRICKSCRNLINEFQNFIYLCQKSDRILRNDLFQFIHINNESIKQEVIIEGELLFEKNEENHQSDVSSNNEDDLVISEEKKRKYKKKSKQTEKQIWRCVECEFITISEFRLKKHFKSDHSNIPYKYICNECDKIFYKKYNLTVHMRIHYGVKPFRCDICNATFTQRSTLISHKFIHVGEKPHLCTIPQCNKRFISKACLRRHMRSHTGEQPYSCEVCSRRFTNIASLHAHRFVHSNNRTHSCSICKGTYKSFRDLQTHRLIHNDPSFVCEECGKKFVIKNNLQKHRKKMHSEGAGTCPICRKNTSNLKEHAFRHSDDLHFKCKICNKAFRHKGILNAHLVLHKNADKYKCPNENCSKTFHRKNLMEFHYNKTHTKETPHHCNVCQQGFYRISDLTRHANTLHANTK